MELVLILVVFVLLVGVGSWLTNKINALVAKEHLQEAEDEQEPESQPDERKSSKVRMKRPAEAWHANTHIAKSPEPVLETSALQSDAADYVVADYTASVAFNEGKVQLYWYRASDRCRMVFLPTAKFLVSKYGRRFEIGECRTTDFANDEAIKAHARDQALAFIKDEIEVKQQSKSHIATEPKPAQIASAVELATPATTPDGGEPSADDKHPYVIGVLSDFGFAAYPHAKKEENAESYFVELQSKTKKFRMWGVDLQRCVADTGAKVGKRVKIVKLGKQPVMIRTKSGQREGLKNLFDMTVLN